MRKTTYKEALAICSMILEHSGTMVVYPQISSWDDIYRRWRRLRNRLLKEGGYCSLQKAFNDYDVAKVVAECNRPRDLYDLMMYYSDRFCSARVWAMHLCMLKIKEKYGFSH